MHSYYGRIDSTKPYKNRGIGHYMLNETIEKIFEKETAEFKKNMDKFLDSFRKELMKDVAQIRHEVKDISKFVGMTKKKVEL